jgi:hypothetical protein
MRLYRNGLAATLTAVALPYGYTLTVWSAGELLRRAHPPPGVAEIILFVAGAACSYGALRFAVGNAEEPLSGIGRYRVARAGTVHLAAITAAVGVAAALATVPGFAAWPLVPFCSTASYLAIVALEQAFEVRDRREQQQLSRDAPSTTSLVHESSTTRTS